ncbi:hypothetical protein IEQ34_005298 [Dendrobium chrysotoxum]|uniref:Uncharacterized protein n=1 Tax=Dendrobium chrysotoxum TaxID=161865 RepID=A0AAV7GTJ8_DENCH|nr:hypothetical protein IEQ34_005298 [Dendrobium chrysotoxum]
MIIQDDPAIIQDDMIVSIKMPNIRKVINVAHNELGFIKRKELLELHDFKKGLELNGHSSIAYIQNGLRELQSGSLTQTNYKFTFHPKMERKKNGGIPNEDPIVSLSQGLHLLEYPEVDLRYLRQSHLETFEAPQNSIWAKMISNKFLLMLNGI